MWGIFPRVYKAIKPGHLQVPLRGESADSFEERFDSLEAVIAGATGKTGQAIAKKLLTSSGAKVKGLVRDTGVAVPPPPWASYFEVVWRENTCAIMEMHLESRKVYAGTQLYAQLCGILFGVP